ncbi:MAG: hypothetical protein KAY46_06530 [Burkholderiaceae bacterium]|nr:hypothetical protein [Burkholderiaceae bacterium]
MLDLTTRPYHQPASTSDSRHRLDLYTPIHKALRAFLSDTLVRVGAMDATDPQERADTCGQVLALLDLMLSHLSHENTFIHTALDSRSPGLSDDIAREHDHHRESLADLGVLARALGETDATHADQLALRLYRHLADFTAENFVHMREEEVVVNARLWARFSDEELNAIHDRLLASIPPDEMAFTLRWLVTALNMRELTKLFGGVRDNAPAPVFVAMFEIARAHMPPARFARLAGALGLWPLPGPSEAA